MRASLHQVLNILESGRQVELDAWVNVLCNVPKRVNSSVRGSCLYLSFCSYTEIGTGDIARMASCCTLCTKMDNR